mgnify:CR=1 FL=1
MTKESEIKEIVPGQGLGIIKFGMTKDQVKLILGNPDDTDQYLTDGIEGEDTETWHYDALELSMEFSESTDWRMVSIATSAAYTELDSESLIGLKRDDLLAKLEEMGFEELKEEEVTMDEDSQTIIASDDAGINFWMEEDELTEIQWVPLLTEEENIDWPEY